ncbi:MAG: integration host factor subunit beta [Elusimicrobiota bacterium]|jgi:nucleoid DNA-binding protein|nr:integration host factor subunit beta [Elusimicrobiota bacterium]
MKKPDVIKLTARRAGITQEKADATVKALIKVIQASLRKGEVVSFRGLGSFKIKTHKAKVGRNIKTGASIPIPSGTKVSFKPASSLKKTIKKDHQ